MRWRWRIGRGGLIVSAALLTAAALAAGQSRKAAKPITVYTTGFEKPVGAEWSVRKTDVTPKGQRRFLGQFCNDRVALSLSRLPPHRYLRISFELFIILSWDGNYPPDGPERYGPDVWTLKVKDGPGLLHCTFAEWPVAPSDMQSFPDEYPGASYKRRTGAAATGTLGYARHDPNAFDAVYRLSFVLAHTDADVTFVFQTARLQFLADESWGLDNVKVEAIARDHALEPKKIAALWEQLADRDPVKACEAIAPLVLAGDSAAKFLGKRLSVAAIDEREVAKLIMQLDADGWKQREQASAALQAMGPAVAPRLRQALAQPPSLEAKTRLEAILTSLEKSDDPKLDPPRLRRAFRVLAAGRGPHSLRAMSRLRQASRGRRLQRRAEAAMIRMGSDLIRPLLAEARAKATAGSFPAAAEACRKAHALAREAEHGAAEKLLDLHRSLQAGPKAAGEAEALWSRLDATLAAEAARADELRKKALAAPGSGRGPPPPPAVRILHRVPPPPVELIDRL